LSFIAAKSGELATALKDDSLLIGAVGGLSVATAVAGVPGSDTLPFEGVVACDDAPAPAASVSRNSTHSLEKDYTRHQ